MVLDPVKWYQSAIVDSTGGPNKCFEYETPRIGDGMSGEK